MKQKKRAEFIEHALTLHAINREISISRRFVKFHAIELRKENGAAYTRSSAVDRIRQLFFAVSLIGAIKLQFILINYTSVLVTHTLILKAIETFLIK